MLISLLALIVIASRGHVVELATNCYGCHVLQKALDCEEDIRLLIVSELLLCDPAKTLINKHASHVWSKVRTRKRIIITCRADLYMRNTSDYGN